MEIYNFIDLLKAKTKAKVPTAIAIGVFDLVHLGHQQIFNTLLEYSKLNLGVETMVITFNKNPKGSSNLDTIRLREKYLSVFEINSLVVIDFSSEFGKLSASEFIQMLIELCDLKALIVGEDFHCGTITASAQSFDLKELCNRHHKDVNVIIKSPVLDSHNRKISSSMIREFISRGELELVPQFTLRPYQVDLAPIPSIPSCDSLSFSRKAVMQLLPPPGMYNGALVFTDATSCNCKVSIDEESLSLEFYDVNKTALQPFKMIDYLNLFCRSQR